jgi:hypothetical protein
MRIIYGSESSMSVSIAYIPPNSKLEPTDKCKVTLRLIGNELESLCRSSIAWSSRGILGVFYSVTLLDYLLDYPVSLWWIGIRPIKRLSSQKAIVKPKGLLIGQGNAIHIAITYYSLPSLLATYKKRFRKTRNLRYIARCAVGEIAV